MPVKCRFLCLVVAAQLMTGLLAAPASTGEVHVAKIFNNAYKPRSLTVRAGDSVRFENWDPEPHTASASDGSWTSGPIAAAGEVTIAIVAGMKAGYICLYHPGMRGSLEVLE